MLQQYPQLFWGVIASMYIGNIMLLGLNLPLIGLWVRMLKVPYHYLAVVVVIICVIGAYSVKSTIFDVGAMVAFGVAGYFMRKGRIPSGPAHPGHDPRPHAGKIHAAVAHIVGRQLGHIH